jgi:hypothetical protein
MIFKIFYEEKQNETNRLVFSRKFSHMPLIEVQREHLYIKNSNWPNWK